MRHVLWLILVWIGAQPLAAQSFEVGSVQDVYKGYIGETIHVPVSLRNSGDEPVVLIIKRVESKLGSTQRDYFCPDERCPDRPQESIAIRLEPGQTLEDFEIAVDAGLASGVSSVRYVVYERQNPSIATGLDLHFSVEERSLNPDIFTHPNIILHEVYPNPVVDHAYVKYDLLNADLDAKVVLHNILGNAIEEYPLPAGENLVKIRAEALSAGIYFYTLYVENEGVVTRKLIVKK